MTVPCDNKAYGNRKLATTRQCIESKPLLSRVCSQVPSSYINTVEEKERKGRVHRMAEDDAADRASQEIKALLRRLDPKGTESPPRSSMTIPLI
jgi:hypothetical protein